MRTKVMVVLMALAAMFMVSVASVYAQPGTPLFQMYVGNYWEYSGSETPGGGTWTYRTQVVAKDESTVPGQITYRVEGREGLTLVDKFWYSISQTEMRWWRAEFLDGSWNTVVITNGIRVAKNPMIVGESWTDNTTGTFNGSPVNIISGCQVESYGDVTVPLGTYKAYKIHRTVTIPQLGGVVEDVSYWVVPYIGTIKSEFTNDEGGLETEVLYEMGIRKAMIDFSGDGNSDILWMHPATGTVALWMMDGFNISSVGIPGAVPSDWVIKGVGDLNANAKSDVIWMHPSTGTVAIWLMDGMTVSSVGVAGAVPIDWEIKGVGDFNGNGKADVLWMHPSTGTVAIWLMDGMTVSSVGVAGAIPRDWEIKGVGDFNADGNSDILWIHPSTGTVALWMMNGTSIASVRIPGAVPIGWEIKGVGDFDGDGKADILWMHPATGTVAIWLMNGDIVSSVGVAGAVPSGWEIKGTGDFNRDGRSDILWMHPSTGTVVLWMMHGTTVSSVGVAGAVPSGWEIKN